jgi:hypothetical protein
VFQRNHLLLLVAIFGTFVSGAWGQGPAEAPLAAPAAPPPSTPGVDESAEVREIVDGLPRPLDVPRSLMEPTPPQAELGTAAERPYFQVDPLLDPPDLDRPGWFVGAEMQLTKPKVYKALTNLGEQTLLNASGAGVQVAPIGGVIVEPYSAPFDWTVGPKLTAGYRLPSGFGGLSLSYRFFFTQGTALNGPNANTGLDGATGFTQHSRLSVNQVDLDYSSREYTPFRRLGMKWWLGLRLSDYFFDSQDTEPGAGGGGVSTVYVGMKTLAIGVHGGVELDWRIRQSGLFIVNKLDIASGTAKEQVDFRAVSSANGTSGFYSIAPSTSIPYVNWQLGVGWQPPRLPQAFVFMGGQIEYWWNVGADSNFNGNLDIANRGFVWQAGFNF